MTIGELIKQRREELGLSRADLERRLDLHGINLPRTTLRYWEEGGRHGSTDWNPDFIRALAVVLETSEYALLTDLGFPIIPEGFTLDDIVLAKKLRDAPIEKRKQAIKMLLAILDQL